MAMRLISLPLLDGRDQDAEGFVTDTVSYVRNVRANTRSATAEEETMAAADGYTVSKIYMIVGRNYRGQPYLIDQATGDYYDIRHTSESGRMINLYVEARQNGKIRDAARDGQPDI